LHSFIDKLWFPGVNDCHSSQWIPKLVKTYLLLSLQFGGAGSPNLQWLG